MKLINLNKFIIVFFSLIFCTSQAEDSVDIWNKKKRLEIEDTKSNTNTLNPNKEEKFEFNISKRKSQEIQILESSNIETNNINLYGIYDPEENNFTLNMWSNTDAEDLEKIVKRINKLNLSKTAENIFIKTILTQSYYPKNMSEKEFSNLKINWMIRNNKKNLLEEFLSKNEQFINREKVIQYLVDESISNSEIKKGCSKAAFIGKNIKDPYLEKFKIYCLILNKKKNQAQLLYEILKEQNQSDKFFDKKISLIFGTTDKPDTEIKDDNLLNFYLSSITVPNFKYIPTKKTKKEIWNYLNSANLIDVQDLENRDEIKKFELAANEDRLDKEKVFEIYKKLNFSFNQLFNAENIYKSLDGVESRALIFQKSTLTFDIEKKLEYLFLLKDLFKQDKLDNVYSKYLSNKLKELPQEEIPQEYKKKVEVNILKDKSEINLKKVKYNDKILHKSKIIKFYLDEKTTSKKAQKDLNLIYKKIKRNKNYFFSAKDLALVLSLELDGVALPKELNYEKFLKKYDLPQNLEKITQRQESGYLALKIVEIIGEDDISNLDPETILIITRLLNKEKLYNFRNEILKTALPSRA